MKIEFLKNKKVLFLGYEYFDYHIAILNALTKECADVRYFSVMNYNFKYSLLRRFSQKMFLRYNRNHGNSILKKIQKQKFDYVLVIDGKQLDNNFYVSLRNQMKDAKFINYHWDAVRINELGRSIIDLVPFFDKVYSFDSLDCEKYDKLNYLPLFYKQKYAKKKEKIHDLSFVGSITKYRRYEYVKKVEKYCSNNDISFKYYLKISLRDYIKFLINGKFMTNINFRNISYSKIQEIYSSSKVVVDLPNQIQSGLTMRVIEVLADGLKLLTSNSAIQHESFFDKKNINIIDLNNIKIDKKFIDSDCTPIDMSNYSIKEWIKVLFSD